MNEREEASRGTGRKRAEPPHIVTIVLTGLSLAVSIIATLIAAQALRSNTAITIISQRAYVTFADVEMSLVDDRHVHIEYKLKNEGNTPAEGAMIHYKAYTPGQLEKADLFQWGAGRLAPHSSSSMVFNVSINDVEHVLIAVIVRYRDAFGTELVNDVCNKVLLHEKRIVGCSTAEAPLVFRAPSIARTVLY